MILLSKPFDGTIRGSAILDDVFEGSWSLTANGSDATPDPHARVKRWSRYGKHHKLALSSVFLGS